VRRAGTAFLLAALATVAPASSPALTPVRVDAGGAVVWTRSARAPLDPLWPRAGAAYTQAESLNRWRRAVEDPILRPFALRRLADARLAARDTLGADSTWAALAAGRSIWAWEALRSRARLARARGDARSAATLLENGDPAPWTEDERAERLSLLVEARAEAGDTVEAMRFARQALARYPTRATTTRALRVLEASASARRESLSLEDERAAAEVDFWGGRREVAARRLDRLFARRGPDAWRDARRRGEILRILDRYTEADAALAAALAAAPSGPDSAQVLLDRARVARDRRDPTRALALYREAARLAPGSRVAQTAWWERGDAQETVGSWAEAAADYDSAAAAAGPRVDDAAFRSGLMHLATGRESRALLSFERGAAEGARFWRGVLLRRRDPVQGTAILRELAGMPGYTFYRVAARETLGVRGWPRAGIAPAPEPIDSTVRLVGRLLALGYEADAIRLIERWMEEVGTPGWGRGARDSREPAEALLAGARVVYEAGLTRPAIRVTERAAGAQADAPAETRWTTVPWVYPPAFDSLFAAWPLEAGPGAVDRHLLRAVAWKESKFDPVARSRSNAIGLLQLKRAAATDVARWFRERTPSERALMDPARNLRYGARYLAGMLERFGGDVVLALAAYNAGPGNAKRWGRLRERGGDALVCEEIGLPETHDYVKTILAVRQAYRELTPREESGATSR